MRARTRGGWGFQDAAISTGEARAAAPALVELLGFTAMHALDPDGGLNPGVLIDP